MRKIKISGTSRARISAGALALVVCLGGQAAQAACGAQSGTCEIAGGTYHLVMPEDTEDKSARPPALMFLHGWGATGQGVLGMSDLVQTARARGYAVIAPDGVPRKGRSGRSWGFHPDRPRGRDEIAFLQAVRDDAARRHGIDSDRVVLGGFSIGGSMVSYLACAAPDAFAAYAPVAGAFWHPHPEACKGPVDLLHTHGWTDGVVPLEGRVIRGAEASEGSDIFAQGDVWAAMQTWRAANGCRPDPGARSRTGRFWRRAWQDCDSGRRLEFALFGGGHMVPPGWTGMALDWFERL